MWLTLDDLRCPACGGFVHPLLDACPTCGAARSSRLHEAAAGPIGAVRLAEAPETLRLAQNLTLRYTIKVNALGRSEPNATLLTAVAHLAEALTYRISGDAVPTAEDASLVLRDGNLLAQSRPSRSLLAEIPLADIVGSVSRHGEVTLHYVAGPTPARAAGVPGTAGTAGLLRMTVSNRRGLLAAKARDDHYENLARWVGVLAAAAAEQRWLERGLSAYLSELGFAASSPAASALVSPTGGGDIPPLRSDVAIGGPPGPQVDEPARSSIQASLAELEQLRAAGLVTDDEYALKRREILARL